MKALQVEGTARAKLWRGELACPKLNFGKASTHPFVTFLGWVASVFCVILVSVAGLDHEAAGVKC